MTLIASELGAWIGGLRVGAPPPALRQKARDHLLDTIGAAIVGDGREPVRIVDRAFRAPGEIPLLIDAAPRALVDAARVNAVAAHAAEIDDTEGCDHTGAVVVPVLLALLEHARRSPDRAHDAEALDGSAGPAPTGEHLLTSLIAGYEVGRRVQNALGGYDAHNRSGWHSTATCGVFAAAAAAAHALGLDATRCTSALAMAASSSAGTWAFADDGSMTKQLHVANAAGAGLRAALLAQAGATGPGAIFEDVWGGFFTTHGAGRARPGELVAGLGEHWHAAHSAIKMYAACRSAHPAIDGVVDALRDGSFAPDQVRSVSIELSPFLRAMICPEWPRTVEQARMSLPISIALLLLGSPLDPDAYTRFDDADVTRVLDRLRVFETEELDTPQSVRVTVRTDSSEHVIERRTARGSEAQPFSGAEVREKFRRLTVPRIGPERSDTLIDYVDSLGSGLAPALPRIWEQR